MNYFEILNDIRGALSTINTFANSEVQTKQRESALRDINEILENCGV